ncbi:hypothetical protein ACET3Z_004996 [Daucus carota]
MDATDDILLLRRRTDRTIPGDGSTQPINDLTFTNDQAVHGGCINLPTNSNGSQLLQDKENCNPNVSSRDFIMNGGIRPGALATILQKRMASRHSLDNTGIGDRNKHMVKNPNKLTPLERRFLHTDFAATPSLPVFPIKGSPKSDEFRTPLGSIQDNGLLQGYSAARNLNMDTRSLDNEQRIASERGKTVSSITPGQST